MTKREKGVATVACEQCGSDLNVVTQSDGGTTAARCENCYPEAKVEKASTTATPTRERGTPIDTPTDGDQ